MRWLSAASLAGLALALLDVATSLSLHASRFVNAKERALFVLAVAALVALSTTLLGAASRAVSLALSRLPTRARVYLVGSLGACAGALLGVALFSGSGVRRMGLRPLGISLSTLAMGALAALVWSRRERLRALLSPAPARWALAVIATVAHALNATVLTRQYELLHGLVAVGCAALFAVALHRVASAHAARIVAAVAVLGIIGSVTAARSNALRASVRQVTCVARFPAVLVGMAVRDRGDANPHRWHTVIAGPKLPLAGLDLVLVTVDALRADRLRALGGRGRTPTLDAVAAHGLVFRRAYCATPHTSYSIASLMMGTYARSVLALPGRAREHGTLAAWLGEAGYATAGFFPPAVFAVDGERFGTLRARHFGFSTAIETYADATTRVREATRWLDTRRPGERVFLWVHLFEPHEPYERHASHPYGDSREARYDAECSAADDAIRDLRAAFAQRGRRAAWVLTADHGEEFGEHGGSFHGTSLYDEQVRVPLIIDAPDIAHAMVDAPVSLVDLAPTLLGGVGLARPPRVRGNNLGAFALGGVTDSLAFASTGSLRMVATARDKLIADLSDGTLERYDHRADPAESRNLADLDPQRARSLRGAIESWEASHAHIESQPSVGDDAPGDESLPDVLSRAIQGDTSVARDVTALLGAGGFPVRRRAARVLGDLGVTDPAVTDALARELTSRDEALRREAAVSLALLRDPRGREITRAALDALRATPTNDESLRVAVALSRLGDHAAVPTLSAWINLARASDAQRDQAVASLRSLRDPAALPAWRALLVDMRLAPRAADAMGELGDPRAISTLRDALPHQGYPLTIRATLGALQTLGAPDIAALVHEGIIAADPLPDLWTLFDRIHEPGRAISGSILPRAIGLRPTVIPLVGGARTDRSQGYRRIYLRVRAAAPSRLRVTPAVELEIPAGTRELSVDLPTRFTGSSLRLSASSPVELLGIAAR